MKRSRLFDLTGAVAVVAWLAVIAASVYTIHAGAPTDTSSIEGQVAIHEGENWLVMMTEDREEIGYVHETRTRVPQGWLFEYDMFMSIGLMGVDRALASTLKATLDEGGYLLSFASSLEAGPRTFRLDGQVHAQRVLEMKLYLGEVPETRTIELEQPPKLSANALNHIIASGDLEEGRRYRQEFFDPTSFGIKEIVYEYQGQVDVDVYDRKERAHHFRQLVAGNELDVYVSDSAEILIQEFPMRTLGMSLPPALGRARAKAIREQLQDGAQARALGLGGQGKERAAPVDLSMKTALRMLGSALLGEDGQRLELAEGERAYQLKGIPAGLSLQLDSTRQLVAHQGNEDVLVVTKQPVVPATKEGPPPPPAPLDYPERLTEAQRAELLEATERIDHRAPAIGALIEGIAALEPLPPEEPLPEGADEKTRERATAARQVVVVAHEAEVVNVADEVASRVAAALSPVAEVAPASASAALAHGQGDCTEVALVTVAALRRLGIPARFVSGVLDEDTKMTPHQWVQYHDGTRFREIDPTRTEDNHRPTPRQIGLVVHPGPEDGRYLTALSKVQISAFDPDTGAAGAEEPGGPEPGGESDEAGQDDRQETGRDEEEAAAPGGEE